MKRSVTLKLSLAFVALTLAVLAATLGLARWSFERGFLDYVNALELVRLQRLRDGLVARYDPALDGWNPGVLAQLLASDSALAPPVGPPPRSGNSGPPPGAPRRPPPQHRGPPTALLDGGGNFLAGDRLNAPESVQMRVPVLVDGEKVAELASVPRRQLSEAPETAFSAQQLRASLIIGAVALAGALLVSLILARALIAPMRRAMAGVNELTAGNYGHRLHEPRDDELGTLMHDIDRLGETLERNVDARNRWIADISHELRTPVAILAGELAGIRDGIRRADSAQIESLAEEVERLRSLIDDLYELSLSDMGGLRYEFVEADVADLLREMGSSFEPRAAAAGLDFDLELPEHAPMQIDVRRFGQLVLNLLENALAYTDAPGRMKVALRPEADTWRLEIEDSAPGVPASECQQIFEPLYRRDASRSRHSAGAGLGLAICRKIVEAHGGRITATPSALGGLKIQVTLWSRT